MMAPGTVAWVLDDIAAPSSALFISRLSFARARSSWTSSIRFPSALG